MCVQESIVATEASRRRHELLLDLIQNVAGCSKDCEREVGNSLKSEDLMANMSRAHSRKGSTLQNEGSHSLSPTDGHLVSKDIDELRRTMRSAICVMKNRLYPWLNLVCLVQFLNRSDGGIANQRRPDVADTVEIVDLQECN